MRRGRRRPGMPDTVIALAAASVVAVASGAATPAAAQQGSTDWASQNLNLHNNRFAPLDEVNTTNVDRLTARWT